MKTTQGKSISNKRQRKTKIKIKKKMVYGVLAFFLLIVGITFVLSCYLNNQDYDKLLGYISQTDDNNLSLLGDSENPTNNMATSGQTNTLSVNITATNSIVMEVESNLILYQKDSTTKTAPASTAKMITALTVLDTCSLEDEVVVGEEIEMIKADASRAWLNPGDTLTVRQLLIALLLPSGNDAAYTLAVHTGRAIAEDSTLPYAQAVDIFMKAVNEKAKALGVENSNFVVPDGYDAEGQYTTAYDLAIIAKECLENPCLSEIVGSYRSYEKWSNGREVTYYNTNKLLDPDSAFYYPETIGIKTGTSELSGESLVSAALINGKTYICVVMGAASNDSKFQDSITIFNAIKAL